MAAKEIAGAFEAVFLDKTTAAQSTHEAKREIAGNFEAVLLKCLIKEGGEIYGVPLRRAAEEMTHRTVSVGALYTTLDRMVTKGYISARIGEATPERGGKPKKYFRVEGPGMKAYQAWETAQLRVQNAWGGLQPTIQAT